MADWLPREFRQSHPSWIVAGMVLLLVGVPLLIAGEMTWGLLTLFIGAGWAALGALGLSGRK